MSFQMAAQQFQENIALEGGDVVFAAADPEKFNLYAGLLNLARGLEALRLEIADLRIQVGNLQQ
jgi:hypothetical protein